MTATHKIRKLALIPAILMAAAAWAMLIHAETGREKNPSTLERTGDLKATPPSVLMHRARAKREKAREKGGEHLARKAGREELETLAVKYAASPEGVLASLMLVRDGFCIDDAGYPDCLFIEVRGYEEWLETHRYTAPAGEVMLELAGAYADLADLHEPGRPWSSETKTELFRGRAVEILKEIIREKIGTDESREAREMLDEVQASGKPYSIMSASTRSFLLRRINE